MKNYKQKILSGLLASAMVFGMGATQLKASAFTYPTVAGEEDSFTFKKFLVVPKGAAVPNVEFTFSIEAGEACTYTFENNTVDPPTTATMEVYSGVGTPTFKTGKDKATFNSDSTTHTTARDGDADVQREAAERKTGLTADTGVQWESSKEVYAVVDDLTVDFSGVAFPEPGIYRYIIRETANAEHEAIGVMHDNHSFRVLDVYVVHKDVTEAWIYNETEYATKEEAEQEATNNGDPLTAVTHRAAAKTLEIANYVMHKGAGTDGAWVENPTVSAGVNRGSADVLTANARLGDKTDGFTNEYKPVDLKFSKTVAGNQGSRDKYFKFTLELSGLIPGSQYNVSYEDDSDSNTTDGNADKNISANPNKATTCITANVEQPEFITAGNGGTVTQVFYLQHGQSIAIRGLPVGATYTLTEAEEDYKPSLAITGDNKTGDITVWKFNENEYATYAAAKDAVDAANAADPTPNPLYTYDVITSEVKTGTDIEVGDGKNSAADTRLRNTTTLDFTNTRDGLIPTGILTVVGPAVVLILLAVAGLSIVMIGKRRKEESAN